MSSSPAHRFQVDLSGIISVLSQHIYSTPTVAFRELLQNSVDAIAARRVLEPDLDALVTVEPVEAGETVTLVVEDNGVGLTEDEVHLFLATIGGSSKRNGAASGESVRNQFIGQFGIGLLSCFVLSDEIVVITRSASLSGGPAVEWRGRGDGTYSVRVLDASHPPGTRLYLRIKDTHTKFCTAEQLDHWLVHYGEFLPLRIELNTGNSARRITASSTPWSNSGLPLMDQMGTWECGTRFFGGGHMDMVPLRAPTGGLEGVAFISGEARSLHAKPRHRLYLKGMLLSDNADSLAPGWAVFANILAHSTRLNPTASRESLMEDSLLDKTRGEIAGCLMDWLQRLAVSDRPRLASLMRMHGLALKSLALENDMVLRSIAPWFEFETSLGRMSFEEILRRDNSQYCISLDRYRQLAPVAAAEGQCLVNAGYVFDAELMAALSAEFPETGLEEIRPMDFTDRLEEPDGDQVEVFDHLLETASSALQPHLCRVEARVFQPSSLPVLYVRNEAALLRREMDLPGGKADDLFGSILNDISGRVAQDACHICYLNASNPLIQRLANIHDPQRLRTVAEVLYLQALLLGQYPLTSKETRLLSAGLLQLIEFGLPTP